MNISLYNIFIKNRFPLGLAVLAFSGVFLFSGCFINFSDYGQYRNSGKVSRMFSEDDLPSDYTYYYANTFARPEALIGIEPGYHLDNNLWSRVNPDQLQLLVSNMYVGTGYSPFIFGSYIVGPKGKVIGIYYSQYTGGPIVVKPGNKVDVYLPNTQLGPQYGPPRLPHFLPMKEEIR